MQGYIIRRVLYAIVSLVLLSITIFCLVRITGDPAVLMAEPGAKEEDLQAIRREFGLDKPIVVQYFVFVKNLLEGTSANRSTTVSPPSTCTSSVFQPHSAGLSGHDDLVIDRHSCRDLLGGAGQHLV